MSGVKPYLNLTLRRYSWETGLHSRSLHLSCRTMLNIGSPHYFRVGYTSLLVTKINGWRCNLDPVSIISLGLNDHILIHSQKENTKSFCNSQFSFQSVCFEKLREIY